MDERRTLMERRDSVRTGRRATDRQAAHYCVETRHEVGKLKAVVQGLIDAVQLLTATRHRP